MAIVDVVRRARREPPYLPPDTAFPENFYVCEVLDPIPWDRFAIEQSYGFELPPELIELWSACGGMRLFCDNLWCPGGLIVCAPTDDSLHRVNADYLDRKSDRMWPGDFIVAEFRSDLELVLMRCDKTAPDFGSIVVVTEMGPREEWYKAALSLEEFLTRFMDAKGAKYWEYHYQKKLAEKATLDLLRKKQQD